MKTYNIDGANLNEEIMENIIFNLDTKIQIHSSIIDSLTLPFEKSEPKKTYQINLARAIIIIYINALINQKVEINVINDYVKLFNNNETSLPINDPIIIASATACLLVNESKNLLKTSNLIIATSLDAYNGNTSPFVDDSYFVRPYATNLLVAQKILSHLTGSSVFLRDINKPVQDPLSFRDAAHINGAWLDCINYLEQQLYLQINSSNNYPTLNWIYSVEEFGQAMSHVSKFSCYRTLKFCNPDFTKLPRFLAYNDSVLGFATLQKVYCSLDAEIRHLSNPACFEDKDSVYTVKKTKKIIDNLRYIIGIELMHACQAIDLRVDHNLGHDVKKVFETYRKAVPMYKVDRIISFDIESSYQLILSNALIK